MSSFALTVETPSDREILLTRRFAAPRTTVFAAWIQAEHVTQWWDPAGVPLAKCEIDARPGGAFHFVNRAGDGEQSFQGTYREISPPERLVFEARLAGTGPAHVATLHFSEAGGETTLIMRIECRTMEERDALLRMRVDAGIGRTLQNLASYLTQM